MRKALMAVLLTGLFLLMLSALVVTPEDAVASEPVGLRPENFHAVLMPMTVPAPQTSPDALQRQEEMRLLDTGLTGVFLCAAALLAACDSNGRILTAVRYENSVYQLFRAEVAGG